MKYVAVCLVFILALCACNRQRASFLVNKVCAVWSVMTSGSKNSWQISHIDNLLSDWPQLKRYQAENKLLPLHTVGRIVFFGDSITERWADKAYADQFFPGKPYVNRGIGGQTTGQMLLRFRQDVLDLHPETVVILGGTDDIVGNAGAMTPEMTESNWQSMAELAKVSGVRVVFCSILPSSNHKLIPDVRIRELNEWLRSYSDSQGLTYVDYYSSMSDDSDGMREGISVEGIHPNVAGYQIMGRLVEAALVRKMDN